MPSWVVAMHLWRRRAATVLVLAAVALAGAEAAAAEQGQTKLTPELLNAIVRIEATVPSDARTARYLGTTRRGSGILIDDDGLIVTIGYLVTEATAAEVTGPDGKPVLATVVGFDNESGLGLLRATDRLDAKPVRLGRSSALKESQVVLVASAESAVAAHVVSRRTFAGYWEYLLEDAIFTQPPIEDWGGAALIGADGTLLGVGSLMVQNALGRGSEPHPGNMFVPIDRLKPVLADLLTLGRPGDPPRPWLGINAAPGEAGGVIVTRVSQEGPAAKAGIVHGDRVLAVAGQPVNGLAEFYREVWSQGTAGVVVPLTIEHGGERREVGVPSVDRYRYLKLDTSY